MNNKMKQKNESHQVKMERILLGVRKKERKKENQVSVERIK